MRCFLTHLFERSSLLWLPLLWILILFCSNTHAQVSSQGEIRLESRIYPEDGRPETKDVTTSLATRLKVQGDLSSSWTSLFQLFARQDARVESRNSIYFEEAYIQYEKNSVVVQLGSQIFNWSATEAFHPTDILNSRNWDGDLEIPEKIGEPAATFSYIYDEGAICFILLPSYVAPLISQGNERLSSLPSSMTLASPLWLENKNQLSSDPFGPQGAIKFDHSFGSHDLSWQVVYHMDRSQPILVLDNSLKTHFLYLPVLQYGMNLQSVWGDWIVKLEGAYRDFQNPTPTHSPSFLLPNQNLQQKDHGQLALGVEYGWSHSSADSTVILEGQSLVGVPPREQKALHPFQRDLLIGYRLTLNDLYSQEISTSLLVDLERSQETLFYFKYKRRLTDTWSMESGLRLTYAPTDSVYLKRDHKYVHLNLSRYF